MIKAIFIDFYGTVVHEDGEVIKQVSQEIFEFALNSTGLSAEKVVHIGDSLSSDVKEASSVGINTIWINRSGREIP